MSTINGEWLNRNHSQPDTEIYDAPAVETKNNFTVSGWSFDIFLCESPLLSIWTFDIC